MEIDDNLRKETFRRNIELNFGSEIWLKIKNRNKAKTRDYPRSAVPKAKSVSSIIGVDPILMELEKAGVSSKNLLARRLGITIDELENALEVADYVVFSKRPGFVYLRRFLEDAIRNANKILSENEHMELSKLAKQIRVYPEDLVEYADFVYVDEHGIAHHMELAAEYILKVIKKIEGISLVMIWWNWDIPQKSWMLSWNAYPMWYTIRKMV